MAFNIINFLGQSLQAFIQAMNPAPPENTPVVPAVAAAAGSPTGREKPAHKRTETSPTQSSVLPMVTDTDFNCEPLTSQLKDYVERFFKNYSKNNLEKLLAHKRGAYMLFHHQMENGHCLFLNLVFSKNLCDLKTIRSVKKNTHYQMLDAALSTIPDENYFLRWVFSIELPQTPLAPKALTLKQIKNNHGMGSLLSERERNRNKIPAEKLAYLMDKLTAEDFLHQYTNTDETLEPSLLHIVAECAELWMTVWDQNPELIISSLKKINESGNHSILPSLIIQPKGLTWFINNLQVLDQKKLLTEALFFNSQYIMGDRICAFHILCCSSEGINSFYTHWSKLKKLFTRDNLFIPFTNKGPDAGASIFYYLCTSVSGSKLLLEQIDHFKNHLVPQGLFVPLTGDNNKDHKNIFYALCSLTSGVKLLKAYWKFFNFKQHLSADRLFATSTDDDNKFINGTNPFHLLCFDPEGISLLKEQWSDFKIHLNSERLFAPITNRYIFNGANSFYLLCSNPAGLSLLKDNWNDFKDLLNKEGLFAQVTGDKVSEKGASSFYKLCETPEGRSLLGEHWRDFKNLLTAEGLFAPLTKEGANEGKSAFYMLCATRDGQDLLEEHGLDFKNHIKIDKFFAPVPGESPLNITPFNLLYITEGGKNLIGLFNLNPKDIAIPDENRALIEKLNMKRSSSTHSLSFFSFQNPEHNTTTHEQPNFVV